MYITQMCIRGMEEDMYGENNSEENAKPTAGAQEGGESPPADAQLQSDVNHLMDNIAPSEQYHVEVFRDGHWVTFEGTVDTQNTRLALFMLVPVKDGKRHIVDRLHVAYDGN